jgi:tetratricopeptide (TPR) repeat protein
MTSHIFLAMGMWNEVVKANETAIEVGNRRRKQANRPPIGCGHPVTWLEYGYLQLGRVDDARRTLEACRHDAQDEAASLAASAHPANHEIDPDASDVGSFASMRNAYLIDAQLWTGDVAAWTLPAGDFPFARFTFDYGTALAALKSASSTAPAAVARVHADLESCKFSLDTDKAAEPHEISEERQRESILLGQLDALLLLRAGKTDAAIHSLQQLAAEEHSMPLEFGPPLIDKPTQELLGEVFLQLNRPAEAHAAFSAALTAAPGRRRSSAN